MNFRIKSNEKKMREIVCSKATHRIECGSIQWNKQTLSSWMNLKCCIFFVYFKNENNSYKNVVKKMKLKISWKFLNWTECILDICFVFFSLLISSLCRDAVNIFASVIFEIFQRNVNWWFCFLIRKKNKTMICTWCFVDFECD